MRIDNNFYKPVYNQNFQGIKVMDFSEFMGVTPEEFVKNGHKLIDKCIDSFEHQPQTEISQELKDGALRAYQEFQRENEYFFKSMIPEKNREICEKISSLPTYSDYLYPFFTDKKKSELEYLYKLASKRDITGEMRIPGAAFPYFSEIPQERLKMLEPIILSKNDANMWNYGPSFILSLDRDFDIRQIEIMSRLAKYKVNGWNLRVLANIPFLHHTKIIEKSESLNKLFGKDLREINFFSTSKGENYLCTDIQLPHDDKKPDYLNFKRLYSKLDYDENPKTRTHSTPETDKYTDNIYNRLEKKMAVFTPENLEKAVLEVHNAIPEAKEEEILRVMQRLTQFASYSQLGKLTQLLSDAKVTKINPNGGINPIFNYFAQNKYIIDLPFQKGERFDGIFITKDDLDNKEFNKIFKRAKGIRDLKFINLEGWSDGINLFNDDKELCSKTISILKRAKKLESKNPEYTFNDVLYKILNNGIENRVKSNGFQIETISIDSPATRQTIIDQLKPIMPTRSILKSTVESVAFHHTKDKKKFTRLCKDIAEYYDENINIHSKQSMIEALQKINAEIMQYTIKNNVPQENIFILTPICKEPVKSFDIVNKMLSNIMDIPQERVLRIHNLSELTDYPKDSVFVIADDICASGQSMTDAAHYRDCAHKLPPDKHILFCPITGTKEGLDYVNFIIKAKNRETSDTVICLKDNFKSYEYTSEQFIGKENTFLNSEVFGEEGHGDFGMCTVFPYMAPDNNSTLSGFLVKFFTPGNSCIKNKSPYLSSIERDTYFYDIFGTDEKHVLTRLDTSESIFDKLKKIFGKA